MSERQGLVWLNEFFAHTVIGIVLVGLGWYVWRYKQPVNLMGWEHDYQHGREKQFFAGG